MFFPFWQDFLALTLNIFILGLHSTFLLILIFVTWVCQMLINTFCGQYLLKNKCRLGIFKYWQRNFGFDFFFFFIWPSSLLRVSLPFDPPNWGLTLCDQLPLTCFEGLEAAALFEPPVNCGRVTASVQIPQPPTLLTEKWWLGEK